MIRKKKIGIFGGTFDPIHNGHLYIAENARGLVDLDKVIFVPSAQPPHKKHKKITSAHSRLTMCNLAIEDNKFFTASDIEIKREGVSYTITTLEEYENHFGNDTELYFIIGADMLADLPNWYRSAEMLSKFKFIALARPGFTLEELVKKSDLLKLNQNNIILLEIMPVKLSSTLIRESITDGRSIRYLVPYSVYDYIKKEQLYT